MSQASFISKYQHLRYLPLKVGNYWVLRTKPGESFEKPVQLRVEVVSRTDVPMGIMYQIKYTMDKEELMIENLLVDYRGIWLYSRTAEGVLLMYDPIYPVLPKDYKELVWWNWQGTVGTVESYATFTFDGVTYLELEDENVPCVKIKLSEENKYGRVTALKFYAEHLGIVREIFQSPLYSYEADLLEAEVEYDNYSHLYELEQTAMMTTIAVENQVTDKGEETEVEELPEDLEFTAQDIEQDMETQILTQEFEDEENVGETLNLSEIDDQSLPERLPEDVSFDEEELELDEELIDLDELEQLEELDDIDELDEDEEDKSS